MEEEKELAVEETVEEDYIKPGRFDRFTETRVGRIVRRHWLTIAFLLGFITDFLLLNRVDDVLDNIILFFYVLLAFTSLALLYLGVADRAGERLSYVFRTYAPLLIQYSFGGLLSGMFIFYGRSADWLVSWPILLLFVLVMILNEMVRKRATRLLYYLSTLYIGLFAYLVLVVPVFIGKMGSVVFVSSGVLSLIIIALYIKLLGKIIPRFIKLQFRLLLFSILSIFFAYNILYFTNIIPPIPLSLIDVGIYHSVVRFDSGEYQLQYEPSPWWQFYREEGSVFHPRPNGSVYCFSSVFAPTSIQTDIQHSWEYKNADGVWQEQARISYSIHAVGSRGFRAYTLISRYHDGRWRCSVETTRGQVLGREYFTIDSSEPPSSITTKVE